MPSKLEIEMNFLDKKAVTYILKGESLTNG